MTNLITREEVVKLVGEQLVSSVENERCDFTNRCTEDGSVEFSGVVEFEDEDGFRRTLHAYYYQGAEAVAECDDMGSLDWEVAGFQIN